MDNSPRCGFQLVLWQQTAPIIVPALRSQNLVLHQHRPLEHIPLHILGAPPRLKNADRPASLAITWLDKVCQLVLEQLNGLSLVLVVRSL